MRHHKALSIGKRVAQVRKHYKVNTGDLRRKGISLHLVAAIEKAERGYTIESLLDYLDAIHPEAVTDIFWID